MRLENGSLFSLDANHPLASRLEVGMSLEDEELDSLQMADELRRCRQRAIDLLARREHCRKELHLKLRKRGFSQPAIHDSLDALVVRGWLDDARFAESWTHSRLRSRPEGATKLCAALVAKGVSAPVAREAVHEVLEQRGDEDGMESLRRAWEKLSRRSSMTDEKLKAALIRRGFSPGRVVHFLREHQDEVEE
ncbi:MAG: recombination regulator RecX [Spirochaetales bacterium]|nr:recombination regulator RecX [Spirochaetales bacterium]